MTITIQSNTDTILELPALPGTLGPGKTTTLPVITEDLVRAIDLGLLLISSGAEASEGLPPIVFDHHCPHALFISAKACYVRALRSPDGFHDRTELRNFAAYYADGAGMSCAFSDDGISWDNEKEITDIAANGYHVVCAPETPDRLRILYWGPDVPNQPYVMTGLRTAVCNPQADSFPTFIGDVTCTGNLTTEGPKRVGTAVTTGPRSPGITRSRLPFPASLSPGATPCFLSLRPTATTVSAWAIRTTVWTGSSMVMRPSSPA